MRTNGETFAAEQLGQFCMCSADGDSSVRHGALAADVGTVDQIWCWICH